MVKKIKNSRRAFTIVEVVIIICVIGILTAVLVPVFIVFSSHKDDHAPLRAHICESCSTANTSAVHTTHLEVYELKETDTGIKIKTKDGSYVLLEGCTCLVYSDVDCPLCGHVEYREE